MNLIYWLDILGTIVFAISGVLLAARKKMDIIGALVLGIITAIGGGTIRDVILNNGGVFWLNDSTDLAVAILASLFSMLFIHFTSVRYPRKLFPILDAIGLAVFVAIGVNKAADAGANGLVMVCMGMMTGVGGGIIRDVLARDVPMIFRKDIYATACIIGGSVNVLSYLYFGMSMDIAIIVGMMVTLVIRLSAIQWNLRLPIVTAREFKKSGS